MKKMEPATTSHRKKGEKSNKKRMATVATVYTQDPRIRTPEEVVESLFKPPLRVVEGRKKEKGKKRAGPQNKRVWASLTKGKDAVLKEVQQEVELRDPDKKKTRVALTDGEIALQKRVLKWLPGVILILDLLHALGYLWKAAYLFHEEGSTEAENWVKKRVLLILQGKVSEVVRGLRQSATKRKFEGKQKETIDKVTGYLYKNRQYMRYHEYLQKGLPIASGAVEGACKNLVKDRMERSGMRWMDIGAEAMLKLRGVYLSRDFDEYWVFHIAQDQDRRAAQRGQKRKGPLAEK
jgi:hypothetical protein